MRLIRQICEQCVYKQNSSATFPCVDCCSRDRWELAETITVNSKDIEALQQEITGWESKYQELDAGHSKLFKDFCGIKQENEKLADAAVEKPPYKVDLVEALKQAKQALELIYKKHVDIPNHNKYPSSTSVCREALAKIAEVMGE